jgi:trimeric autotransporter adhesin
MADTCGSITVTGTVDIDMVGVNGDHDCDTPTSGGNSAATRFGMYEVNKIFEEARGYLPNNTWLNGTEPGPLQTNMNIIDTCNAFYDGSINFYRTGGGCRNTGEIAAVFDHEWAMAWMIMTPTEHSAVPVKVMLISLSCSASGHHALVTVSSGPQIPAVE